MGFLDDKIRIELTRLVEAQQFIFSAIAELRRQNYTTEADNLQTTLDTLKTQTDAALAAISS